MRHIIIIYFVIFSGVLFANLPEKLENAPLVLEAIPVSLNFKKNQCKTQIKYLVIGNIKGNNQKKTLSICYQEEILLKGRDELDISLNRPYLLFLKNENGKIEPYKPNSWQYQIKGNGDYKNVLNTKILNLINNKKMINRSRNISSSKLKQSNKIPAFRIFHSR
jgi:hypothetical protein